MGYPMGASNDIFQLVTNLAVELYTCIQLVEPPRGVDSFRESFASYVVGKPNLEVQMFRRLCAFAGRSPASPVTRHKRTIREENPFFAHHSKKRLDIPEVFITFFNDRVVRKL